MADDQTLNIAEQRQKERDAELGREFVRSRRLKAVTPESISQWKSGMPASLPSDDDYDYARMFADGNTPQKSSDPENDPSFLPQQYYRGDLKHQTPGNSGRWTRSGYNLDTGNIELTSSVGRVVRSGVEGIFTGIAGMFYDAGTLLAFPVDVVAETAKQAHEGITAGAVSLPGGGGVRVPMNLMAQQIEAEYEEGGDEAVQKFYDSPIEVARDKMFERWNFERPRIGGTEVYGTGENIASMFTTIIGDFVIGGKMAGVKKLGVDATKMQKFTSSMIDNIKTGIYGEYLFSHVDEEGGNVATVLRAVGFDNAFTQAMDTQGMDNDMHRVLLNTLEGAMLGSIWHLGKAAKDLGLMKAATVRAEVIAERLSGMLSGGPAAGSPAAQRGAVGNLDIKWRVTDQKTGDVVGTYKTRAGATRAVDRLDNEYGGYRYSKEAFDSADEGLPAQATDIDTRIGTHLTDQEKALMTPKDRTTIESLLQTTATPAEVASMAAAGGAKRGWYKESVAALRHVFGDDADRFASLLSATSPQTSVESNLRNALNIWRNWDAAGRPQDLPTIKRIMGDSVEGTKGEESVLGAWINNTARAFVSDDPLAGLSGPKVDSFMRNLSGNMTEVTQDTWMARALGMDQSRDFAGRNLKDFSDEIGSIGQKKPGYLAGNILVREAADIMKKATGDDWSPAEIQETVWSWAKAIYESKGAAGETRSIPQILQSGEITDDIVRDTADFATLFSQKGEFHDILEGAGYGEQIRSLPESGFGQGRATSAGAGQSGDLESAARRLDRTSRTAGSGTVEDLNQLYRRTIVRPADGSVSSDVPGSFRRRVRGAGTGYLKGEPVQTYNLPAAQQADFKKLGVATPPMHEFSNPQKFHDAISQAKSAHPQGASVHVYDLDEYADMRTFVTTDGSAGFAIKSDGDIVSVFNNRAGPHRGVSPHMVALAIEQGGKKLDAFEGPLTRIYDSMNFKEVGRDSWDESFRPEGWTDEMGTPDIVYMELQ